MQASSDNPVVVILAFLAVLGAVGALYRLQIDRAEAMLRRWADKQSLELTSVSYRPFGGPFWFRGQDQWVFEIVARDPSGGQRQGHAICGSLFLGLWSDQVDVKWSNR